MKLQSLEFKGFGPYSEVQRVEFPRARKVVLLGENGAGKTFFFDAIPAALFKAVPNRKGGFYEQFSGNDAYIDLTFEMGGDVIQARRLINANSRTQKAFLYKNGEVLCDGKDAAFAAEVQKLGINETSFLAAIYQTQNGVGNALNMDVDSRIKLLSIILDLVKFDEDHEKVVAAHKDITRTIEDLKLRRAELDRQRPNVEILVQQKAEAIQESDKLEQLIRSFDERIQAATDSVAMARANAQGVEDLKREAANLEAEVKADELAEADKAERLKNNHELVLNRKAEIENAVTMTAFQNQAIEKNNGLIEIVQQRLDDWNAKVRQELDEWSAKHRVELETRNKALTEGRAKLLTAEGGLRRLQDERKSLASKKAANEQAISSLRPSTEIIDRVPCKDMAINAECELLKNAHANGLEVARLIDENHLIESQISTLDGQIQEDEVRVEDLKNDVSALEDDVKSVMSELPPTHQPPEDFQGAIQTFREMIKASQAEIANLAELVKWAPRLEGSEERAAELEKEIAVIQSRLKINREALEMKRARIQEAANLEQTIRAAEADKAKLLTDKTAAEKGKESQAARVGEIDAQIHKAEELSREADVLGAEIAKQSEVLAEVQILREGLGPKGAKNVKIDAAGRAITERANRLIRIGMGPQFSIVINTLRELQTKDENGNPEVRETLELKIINSETGEEMLIENLSGGEKAMTALVFSLSLAVEQREASGLDVRTLILDEPSAGLSEENSVRYLNMLDAVLDETGLEQVFFISHMPVMQNLADASIFVRKGRDGESSRVEVLTHAVI